MNADVVSGIFVTRSARLIPWDPVVVRGDGHSFDECYEVRIAK